MYPYGTYVENNGEIVELNKISGQFVWTVNSDHKRDHGNRVSYSRDREYSYDEAIDIAGTGCYTIGLLAVLSLSLVAMSIDMFSFSTIVALSSCDFYLTHAQAHILLSMPFAGPIVMAYSWGYVSDTQGRRKSLLIAMSVSFLMAVLCVFAPNWIVLGIFKFLGTCFCSCAQSVTYALLGESCSERRKSTYLLIMTSMMHVSIVFSYAVAHFVGYLDFEYDLGFIVFVPWRLLVLILALPLGLSAFGLLFFYESPKFLLNAGKEDQALAVLTKICKRNRGSAVFYPVKKVVLDEVGNLTQKSGKFFRSLWQQTAPLFKPPLLWRTLLLYSLIFIIYSSTSSIFVWLPFLANDFTEAVGSTSEQNKGLCHIIGQGKDDESSDAEYVKCTSRIQLPILIFTASVGLTYCMLNFVMSKLASRKKALMIVIFVFSSACCIGAMHVPNSLVNIIMFFGIVSDSLCMGIVFAYCVDFYPTSFRGMAACLGVMVARVSGILGVNFIGAYITWHCSRAFYALSGLIFSGAVLSCLLPSDNVKKL